MSPPTLCFVPSGRLTDAYLRGMLSGVLLLPNFRTLALRFQDRIQIFPRTGMSQSSKALPCQCWFLRLSKVETADTALRPLNEVVRTERKVPEKLDEYSGFDDTVRETIFSTLICARHMFVEKER